MMKDILDWGIEVVLWFQQFSPDLDVPFKIITFFGDEGFFLLFFPTLYWCWDKKNGIRLTLLFLVSAYINFIAKSLFDQPRPYQYDSRVEPIVRSSGGGLPSGHTQGSVVLWGFLMSKYKLNWLMVLGIIMIIIVPLSRIYLGVHFPTDLLGGYIIGFGLLLLYLRIEPKVERWFSEQRLIKQILFAAILPLVFFAFSNGDKEMVSVAGALLGLSVGFVLEDEWVRFDESGVWWQKTLRFIAGVIGLGVFWLGVKIIFQNAAPEMVFQAIRYILVGLWGGFGAPWLFVKLKLASRHV